MFFAVFVLCAFQFVAISHAFNYDYGQQTIRQTSPNSYVFTLSPAPGPGQDAIGGRISSPWKARSGWACADIKNSRPAGGSVFAMYLTSGEPSNRQVEKWDELDIEFLHNNLDKIWINKYKDGSSFLAGREQGEFKPLGFWSNSGFYQYCIDWDIDAGLAKWRVNHKDIHTFKLEGWKRPLQLIFSFWGRTMPGWSGDLNFQGTLTTEVRNIIYQIRKY